MRIAVARDTSATAARCDLLTLVCQCGYVLLACGCPAVHAARTVAACGRCTATGGIPVLEDDSQEA
jgi:hypothetical protein